MNGNGIRRLLGAGRRPSQVDGQGTDELLQAGRAAWQRRDKEAALDALRKLLLIDPMRADVWLLTGRWAIEASKGDIAFMALQNCLQLRPGNLDALELLVEVSRHRSAKGNAVSRATDRMVAELRGRQALHRDAIAFVIPARHEPGLAVLGASEDLVTREVISLYRAARSENRAPVAQPVSEQAELLYALAVGKVSAAVEIMTRRDPEGIPVATLRRAIRRQLALGYPDRAARLAKQLLVARPGDGWAESLVKSAASDVAAKGATTNYALLKSGFPFGAASDAPAYTPDAQRALYLLHNSLPYNSAGYATRSHGLLRALNESWNVRAVTRTGYPFDTPGHDALSEIPPTDQIDNVTYERLTTAPGRWQKNPITDYVELYSRELEEVARRDRPFVIHAASNHWNGLTAVETARRLGIPSVYEIRGLWEVTRGSRNPDWRDSGMYRYIARMEADAARHATRVLTITGGLRDEMIDRGVPDDRIVLVPNGVDTERFVPVERDEELARSLGLVDKKVIGYVGSLLDYEGLDLLIRAAAALDTRRDDFHVLLVGDGAEREQFEALAEELGLLDRVVTFTGRVPHHEVEKYYSLVDIAPFPRLPLEVCELVSPLKPFEAMAMGKAVVSSDVRALAEIVEDGVNGLLHTKGSHEDLVRVLDTLLEDDGLRHRLGKTGREWVVAERDWRSLGKRVSEVYAELGEAVRR
ncbi:glycosyltransferase family 4 protein [Promicromonospora aerolata]|uniref:D-inositol 3-phosphate glycosyltransferase n=1 Tax=Promicromonospora aerolata TaxID=195749 RepID=A0ABW4VBL0_9MICO